MNAAMHKRKERELFSGFLAAVAARATANPIVYWVLRTVISVQYKSQIFALMRFYYRVPAGR